VGLHLAVVLVGLLQYREMHSDMLDHLESVFVNRME